VQIASGSATIADYQRGWTTSNLTASGAGGTPPRGDLDNGLNNAITAWLQWVQAGGAIPAYDASFASSGTYNIGGYPEGALLTAGNGDGIWQSTVDNNTVNPNSGPSSNWRKLAYLPSGGGWRNPAACSVSTNPINYQTQVSAPLSLNYSAGTATIQQAGTYDVEATVTGSFNSAGQITLVLYQNGTVVDECVLVASGGAASSSFLAVGALISCAVNDTVYAAVALSGGAFTSATSGHFKLRRAY
jgi:hypothetical protein